MTRFRMPAFSRRTCSVPECGAHFWPRRRGPHLACELIIPTPGVVLGAVYRRLNLDGTRTAHIRVYDPQTQTWSVAQPLPRRPRRAWQGAVRRARVWVADRDGIGMAVPSGSLAAAVDSPRVRRTRTRARPPTVNAA